MRYLLYMLCIFLFSEAKQFEKSKNIVIDIEHNLMWQDNNEVTQYLETSITAEVYCETMILNGYTDWRVPNIYELLSVIDVKEKNAINKKFLYVNPNIYNTSSSFIENDDFFLGVDFKSGVILTDKKINENYIRCVRDI